MSDPTDLLSRLVHGDNVEEIRIYDVSDCILHGSKHSHELQEPLATMARSNGLEPIVYQSVYWFCIVFIPFWPLGTNLIIPYADFDEEDDAERYRGIRIEWDWKQVVLHWLVGPCLVTIISAFALLVFYSSNTPPVD